MQQGIEQPAVGQIGVLAPDLDAVEAAGGVVLLVCTVTALVLANTQAGEGFLAFWKLKVEIRSAVRRPWSSMASSPVSEMPPIV